MNAAQRELFRQAILRVLDANNTRFGLGAEAFDLYLGIYNFPSPAGSGLAAELQYLADKGFVALVNKEVSPENRAWRITAAGRDYLAGITNE